MKKRFIPLLAGLLAMTLLTGCLVLNLGGGPKTNTTNSTTATNSNQCSAVDQQMVAPTLGRQLMDLQKAKDSGAITEQEYQDQRTKLLQNK